jgi:hypothetical protein
MEMKMRRTMEMMMRLAIINPHSRSKISLKKYFRHKPMIKLATQKNEPQNESKVITKKVRCELKVRR